MSNSIPHLKAALGLILGGYQVLTSSGLFASDVFEYHLSHSVRTDEIDATCGLSFAVRGFGGTGFGRSVFSQGQSVAGVRTHSHAVCDQELVCEVTAEDLDSLAKRIDALDLLQFDRNSRTPATDESVMVSWRDRTWHIQGGHDVFEVLKQIDGMVGDFVSLQRRSHPGKWKEVSRTEVPDDSPAIDVSLTGLLEAPDHFDGRRVRVSGIIYHDSENLGLFLRVEDLQRRDFSKGVSMGGPSTFATILDADLPDPGSPAVVEGVFDRRSKGHGGLWPGEISRVTRVTKRAAHETGVEK